MTKRIGFACKWIDRPDQMDGVSAKDDAKKYNSGTTTVAWLNRQSKQVAEEKLWSLMKSNIESARLLVQKVGSLENDLRMVRLSSDLLPVYTQSEWRYFYGLSDVRQYCERHFAEVGRMARLHDVRLSFHPGQFTVLASDNPGIVNNSIEEFEYHVDMARWMGYGQQFQDFKINVHISGKRGPDGIREAYKRLSPEARNTLTLENEENAWGLDDCLSLSDIIPTVLDVHHHWVREGEYLEASSEQAKRVVDSWRGVRPTLHYSISREDCLIGHSIDDRPCRQSLIESGTNRQKLRAHSDFYWNNAVNDWVLTFRDNFDIMCESKAKNLASRALYEYATR